MKNFPFSLQGIMRRIIVHRPLWESTADKIAAVCRFPIHRGSEVGKDPGFLEPRRFPDPPHSKASTFSTGVVSAHTRSCGRIPKDHMPDR